MGNRAVIAFGKDKDSAGIYLHWNGGRASVEAFLQAAKQLNVRGDYGCARLTQIIGNWFGGTLSVDVGARRNLDCANGDNGVYVVDEAFNIVGREFHKGADETNPQKTAEILAEVLAVNAPIFAKGN